MANTFLTPTMVTRAALKVLHNNLRFAKNVNRQYDSQFANEGLSGGKIGPTLKIRLPNKYAVRTGATISTQEQAESSVTLTVATQKGVDMYWTSADMTLSVQDFTKRFIEPAMARLASQIDYDGLSLFSDIYNTVGTAGTTPSSALVYLQAGQKLNEFAAPMDQRSVVFNPGAQAATINGLAGLFNNSTKISDQYDSGEMGSALGFKFNMDQNVQNMTTGSRLTTDTIVTAETVTTQGQATINLSGGTTTATIVAGDVFTIANVYAVNPETGVSTGALQQFVCTELNTASGGAWTSVKVSPEFRSTGAYKTIDSLPATTKAITFVGSASTSYPQNLAFHRDAFTLATADLDLPQGVDFKAREVFDGISLRLIRAYDVNNDLFVTRLDCLYGWKTLRANQACRIVG